MASLWSVLPFGGLLLAIAILPLAAPRFWESNRKKALITLLCILPAAAWFVHQEAEVFLHTAEEYAAFLALLGALFVISGGISVTGDLRATPGVNTLFLGTGAVLANLIGTTGASVVLIRPFLRTNSERKHIRHLPVFFIFVVANCGGLLTPLGDPPLFLGYLRGVPFFWTLRLVPIWLLMVGALLAIFYCWDRRAYRRERPADLRLDRAQVEPLRIRGLANLGFVAGVLYAVFLPMPWRAAAMIGMAAISFFLGPKQPRRINHFTWAPIVEIAILFAGIFVTMVPALQLLHAHAPQFGLHTPADFFWVTGGLSGVLDNAPTYLTFLSVAQGMGFPNEIVGIPDHVLRAISVGAVFMGANTYIGNGPNFMVKAIADHAGFKTPSFFGYIGYVVIILLPLYGLLHLCFFSNTMP